MEEQIEEKELESLFKQLTRRGKIRAIKEMAETMPKKLLEKAIDYTFNNSYYDSSIKLAEIAEKIGLTEKAQELYSRFSAESEEKEDWSRAEEYAEKAELGMEKIQELAMKAMKEDEKSGYVRRLAHYAMKAGLGMEKAQEIAMKVCASLLTDNPPVGCAENAEEIAGKIAEDVGLIEKAIECYETGRCWDEAIKLAEEAGLTEKAQELYPKSYKHYVVWGTKRGFFLAAGYAEKAGMIEEVIRCYERGEYWEEAVEFAKKAGLKERAQKIGKRGMEEFEQEGMFSEAAELAKRIGSERLQLYRTLERLIQK